MTKKINSIPALLFCLFLGFSIPVISQVDENSDLYIQLIKTDSIVFEQGFNKCNLEALQKVISSDFEFYHDKGGQQGRKEFFDAMKANICSSPNFKPIRKLVSGSMEVFPLRKNGKLYGALQNGTHEFYIKEPGKEIYITNIAKFTNVFILEEGVWRYRRIVSFDHEDPRQQ